MKYDYWYGPEEVDRRVKYASVFTPEIQAAGDEVIDRVNSLLTAYYADGGAQLPGGWASGWRPPAVNDATANAAKGTSKHLTADAGDVRDTVDGALAWWCMRHPGVLEQHGLWMEHPVATVVRSWVTAKKQGGRAPTPWCHLQRAAPHSGARCFMPDTAAITEWKEFTESGGEAGIPHAAWLELGGGDDPVTGKA